MSDYSICKVTGADSALLRKLASECAPLDLHTPYTYWVISSQFGDSCYILYDEDRPVGFITSLSTAKGLFIWQIGLLEEYRGKGLSAVLIDSVFKFAEAALIGELSVTIAPENLNSFNAFNNYCAHNGYSFEKSDTLHLSDYLESDFFETENIYRCRKLEQTN